MAKVELKKRTLVHEGTSLRAYTDLMETDEGYTEVWDYIEHKFNASAIIPVLPNGNILLVSQFRPATGRMTWEIPAGKRDDNGKEDPYVCAGRELTEETGYSSDDLELLMVLRPAVAYCSETIHIYVARDIYPDGGQKLDAAEYINVKEFTVDDIKNKIRSGEIQDAKTICAVLSI